MANVISIDDLFGQGAQQPPLPDVQTQPEVDAMGNATGGAMTPDPLALAPQAPAIQTPSMRQPSPVPGFNDPEFSQPVVDNQSGSQTVGVDDLFNGVKTVPAGTPERKVNFAGYETPEELDFIVQPAMDTAIGVNSQLATLAAIPIDNVNSILIDMVGKGFLDTPGSAKEMFQKSMESVGAAAGADHKAVNQFWEHVGENTANGLVALSAMMVAAPWMAAAQGETTTAFLMRALGQGLQKNPGIAIRGELGGAVGGEVGRSATEGTPLEPLGATVGTIMGGIGGGSQRLGDAVKGAITGGTKGTITGGIGGAITGSPELGAIGGGTLGAGVGARSGIFGGPQAEREALKAIPKGTPAIIDQSANMDVLAASAKTAVAGDIVQADNAIDDVLRSVPNMKDPLRAAERLRNGLRKAYDVAQSKAEVIWNKVNSKAPVDVTPLKQIREQMLADSSKYGLGQDIPGDILEQIDRMPLPGAAAPQRPGAALFGPGKAGTPAQPDVNDLKQLRGVINARLRNPSAGLTDTNRRNLVTLQKQMADVMAAADPENPALQQGREFSRWLHTTFDEGPIGGFLKRRSGGPDISDELGDMSDPGKAAEALLRREKAGSPIAAAAEKLDMPSLVSRSEQYIRETFGAEAAKSPEGAAKFLGQPRVKAFMQSFPKVNAEMETVGNDLGTALTQRRTIENSAFTKFAKDEPQVAVNRVWASGNKVKDAREITSRIANDPDAMAAWRLGHMEELVRTTKGSPSAIRDRLASKDTGPMLREVFGEGQFNRIQRNINDAAEIELHGESANTRMAKRGVSFMSRLAGLKAASIVSSGGPGSLATASMIGKATENMMSGFTQAIQPDVLLARALIDPKFERILWAKAPQNLKDATAMTDQMRRIVTSIQATNSALSARNQNDE